MSYNYFSLCVLIYSVPFQTLTGLIMFEANYATPASNVINPRLK